MVEYYNKVIGTSSRSVIDFCKWIEEQAKIDCPDYKITYELCFDFPRERYELGFDFYKDCLKCTEKFNRNFLIDGVAEVERFKKVISKYHLFTLQRVEITKGSVKIRLKTVGYVDLNKGEEDDE